MRRRRVGSLVYDIGRRLYYLCPLTHGDATSTLNRSCGHINFFTLARLINLLKQNGFTMVSLEKQGLITSVLPLRRIDWLARAEDAVAQLLPPALCGWWGLVAVKKGGKSGDNIPG